MYSKRNFFVVGFESGIKIEKEYTLSQILDNTDYTEVRYSLLDILDNILDLKVNESLFIDTIRGDNNSKGVLLRVS